MDASASNWTNIASVLIAFFALAISALSFFNSARALRIAHRQEERKRPRLIASLLNGYVHFLTDGRRTYGFLLSISNPTDSDNAVASAELRLTYTTSAKVRLTVQLPANPTRGNAFVRLSDFHLICIPLRLDAHQSFSGWLVFQTPKAILNGSAVEGYAVALIDSHGIETVVEPVMVQEYVDEDSSAL